MIAKYILVILSFLMSITAFSQTSDEELAHYYYNNGEFEKANLYFEKVYKKNDQSSLNYTYYKNTLLELKEYKKALKIAERRTQKYPKAEYQIDIGEILEKWDKTDKANKHYNKLINDLKGNDSYIPFARLAAEFTKKNKLDFALKVYMLGNQNIKNSVAPFDIYIADIYGRKAEFNKMITTYLNLLDKQKEALSRVQSLLPRSIDFEVDSKKTNIVKVELLKRIQKNPEKTVFNKMLIWLFQQKGDFNSAFIQVKALDKRSKAKGEEVYKFSETCKINKKYDLAIKGYEYILSNFENDNYYYNTSKRKILSVLKSKITTSNNYTLADLKKLESRYLTTISSLKNYREKTPLMIELANIEAYYIHNIDTAEIILNTVLKYPGLNKKIEAKTKIDKGDILLIKGDVWDASLLFMQVEKKFKHDVIGHTAKFKNAKLYYYTGDYEWCQNQLNSLKASTSKLISNNAMDLSLLITDNYNMDTTVINMKRFSEADLLIFQNKLDKAVLKLDSINDKDPAHSLNDEILFKRYEIAFKRKKFKQAQTHLNEIIINYSEDILADNAIFKLAELYENQLSNLEKAKEYYGKLLFDYPGSLFVVEARKRYRRLAGEDEEKPNIRSIEK